MERNWERPGHEIFLVLARASERLPELRDALRAMQTEIDACQILDQVDFYYRSATDFALIGFRFVRQWTALVPAVIRREAKAAGVKVILPYRMNDEEYASFVGSLDGFEVSPDFESIDDALAAFARRLTPARVTPTVERAATASTPEGLRLEVRFRRGHEWLLGRVLTVSANEIHLATNTPPGQSQVVELELSVGSLTCRIRSVITGVDRAIDAGAIQGFRAAFLVNDTLTRESMDRMLDAATRCWPTLPPPPHRGDPRFPVKWAVLVETDGQWEQTIAHNLSRRGLFLETERPLEPLEDVRLLVPLDDQSPPLRAHARIMRHIAPSVAALRKIPAGFGVEITGFDGEGADRYLAFVERVSRRVHRHIVVGADAERAAELASEFSAAGYVVTFASEPEAILNHAADMTSPKDLFILDGSLPRISEAQLRDVRVALALRKLPTLRVDGASTRAARRMVDQVLLS